MTYDPDPRYDVDGVEAGWRSAVASLPAPRLVLAVDGPPHAPWEALTRGLQQALVVADRQVSTVDVRHQYADWPTIVARTSTPRLGDDPDFERLCRASMEILFDTPPTVEAGPGVTVVLGPGAALVHHDVLWFADVPKRVAEAMQRDGTYVCLGGRDAGDSTTRRLFFVDWPLTDHHRDGLAGQIDRWFDVQDPATPRSMRGDTLRRVLSALSHRPFRTRPWFNTTVWGGHWAQHRLDVQPDAENTALGYELIAPESSVVLCSGAARLEVPLQLVATLNANSLLGPQIARRFGTSFPIRFDYLDTDGGGPLSVHCHPTADFMRDVFGWPYTQHESYYVMKASKDSVVHLGLRGDADLAAFRAAATHAADDGEPFDIERYVQTFPAREHQLFLIPAGTPHASGSGNVVLEISATPYLYSLRFYDWLRGHDTGRQRPVHVEHAFTNLAADRRGDRVRTQLLPRPETIRTGDGWRETLIGSHDEMFFEVRRHEIEPGRVAPDATEGRFHVLNVVAGGGAEISTSGGANHHLGYAETLIVPAAVGGYELHARGAAPVQVVKALVA